MDTGKKVDMDKVRNVLKNKIALVFILIIIFLFWYLIKLWLGWNPQIPAANVQSKILGFGRGTFVFFLLAAFLEKNNRRTVFLCYAMETLVHILLAILAAFITQTGYGFFVWNVTLAVLAYVALPNMLAVVMGFLMKRIKSDFWSSLAVVVTIAVVEFPVFVCELLNKTNLITTEPGMFVYRRMRLFQSYNGSMELQNPYNPFYVVGARWQWICGWILIGAALLCLMHQLKKGRQMCIAGALIGSVLLAASYFPQNEYYVVCADAMEALRLDYVYDSWNEDKRYYEGLSTEPAFNGAEQDFAITGYDIRIRAGRRTDFQVTCSLEVTEGHRYEFTLYHNYQIGKVIDGGGNQCDYVQAGDSIVVEAAADSDSLQFSYNGVAPIYMADNEQIMFPEYYKYYPVSGRRQVYDEQRNNYVRDKAEQKAAFHVVVDAPYEVYSNLGMIGRNEFAGEASGVTLLGGRGVGVLELAQGRVIYPKLLYTQEQILGKYKTLCDLYEKNDIHLFGLNWMVTGYKGGGFANYFFGEDYFLGSFEEVYYMMPFDFERKFQWEDTK